MSFIKVAAMSSEYGGIVYNMETGKIGPRYGFIRFCKRFFLGGRPMTRGSKTKKGVCTMSESEKCHTPKFDEKQYFSYIVYIYAPNAF